MTPTKAPVKKTKSNTKKKDTARLSQGFPKKQPDAYCNGRRANWDGEGTPYCERPSGWGTDHPGFGRCKRHGGATKLGSYGAQLEAARQAAIEGGQMLGAPVHTDPHTALMEELEASCGHVEWLRLKVEDHARQNGEDALVGPVGQEGPSESGGKHYAAYEKNVWWVAYNEERERKVKIAAVCIKSGIEERRVRVAEAQGIVIARVIQGVSKRLGFSEDPELPQIVREELTKASEGIAIEGPGVIDVQ